MNEINLACDADHYSSHKNHIGEVIERGMFEVDPWGTINYNGEVGCVKVVTPEKYLTYYRKFRIPYL